MLNLNITNKSGDKKPAKKQAVIFVDRERCTFITYPSRTINVYAMSRDSVLYGEVINRSQLISTFAAWMQQNSLVSCECVVVVSTTATFEAVIKKSPKQEEMQTAEANFLSSVPHERVIVARLTQPDQSQVVVATNKDLVTAVIMTLEDYGFEPQTVLPYKIIGTRKVAATGNAAFDLFELGRFFLDRLADKSYQSQEFNIMESKHKRFADLSVKEAANAELSPRAIAIVMAGFFIIAGGIVWYSFYGPSTTTPQSTPNTNVQNIPQAQVASDGRSDAKINVLSNPDGQAAATPAPATVLKIQILYGQGQRQDYEKIKVDLESKAGVMVDGVEESDLGDSGNIALFNRDVSEALRSTIITVLADNGYQTTTKTAKVTDYAGVINLSAPSSGASSKPSSPAPTQSP